LSDMRIGLDGGESLLNAYRVSFGNRFATFQ
jgi:hypothetical protein